ncbi:hypothetical protein D3C81_2103180 [compost metagenome]
MHERFVALAAAQQGFYARFQFGQFERLGHVVVGAQVQALHFLIEAAARREYHDGSLAARAAARAQAAQHVQAIHLRQGQVKQHQ